MNPDFRKYSVNIDKPDVFVVPVNIHRNGIGPEQLCHIEIQITAVVNMHDSVRICPGSFNHLRMAVIHIYIALRHCTKDLRFHAVAAFIGPAEQIPPADINSQKTQPQEQEKPADTAEYRCENDRITAAFPADAF